MTLAFIFPGQGSQEIGMGRALAETFPAAKAVFEEVNAALGQDLSGLMWGGDLAELTLTSNAQPALMAHSVAAYRALEATFGITVKDAAFVAGHSLGEYSALAAAGSISLADTARLLRIRGNAMQSAVKPGEGAMAALLGPISKRQFGQNERSTFGFLSSVEAHGFRAYLQSTLLSQAAAHNVLLQVQLEQGVPGVLFFYAALAFVLWQLHRQPTLPRAVGATLLATGLSIWVVGYPLTRGHWVGWLCFTGIAFTAAAPAMARWRPVADK
jgi:malonyl CoA-acyl carrier protein transacylase